MPSRWSPRLAFVIPVVALGALLALGAGSAHADGDDPATSVVAIVVLEVSGDAAPQLRAQAQASVLEGLKQSNVPRMSFDRVVEITRRQPDLRDCESPSCVSRLGTLLGAERLLRVRIKASGASYAFDLELASTAGGEPRQRQETCPVCTTSEAGKALARAVSDFFSEPPAESILVEINTEPEGATLRIDDRDVGVTPYRGRLAVGQHTLIISKNGHRSAEQAIEVKEGDEPQRFDIELAGTSLAGPSIGGGGGIGPVDSGPSRPFAVLKWVGAAGAVGALGAAVVWLAVDGRGTCDDLNTCPRTYDTRTLGFFGLGAGVALGAATTWMFLRDREDVRDMALSVVPTAGRGIAASLFLRF